VRQARAEADRTKRALQRATELFNQAYLAQASLDNARAANEAAQAALQTAQVRLSMAVIKSPVSGIIVSRQAVQGQIVQPGVELFRIVRDARIELNMQLTDEQLNQIKAGQSATVYADNGAQISGTVRIVTPRIDTDTRLGFARISVPWTSGLRPGMFARAVITLGEETVLVIPRQSVVYKENKPGTFVVTQEAKARYTPVILGEARADKVVVTSGLSVNDRVVTTGAGFLNNGDKITLAAPKTVAVAQKG
jgi:RND family efflux transporter MFP subunit